MTLDLQQVLSTEGIPPTDVNVILHSPSDRRFSELMPGLAKTRRGIIEAYHATHSAHAAAALKQGRRWAAVFLKTDASVIRPRWRMLFLGLYENRGCRPLTHAEIRAHPDVCWLRQNTTTYQDFVGTPDDAVAEWFDLAQSERMAQLQGRLVVDVRLTPNYIRRGENIDAPVSAIHAEGVFDAAPPDWRAMTPTGGILRELPPGWAARLREWRGIYLITDERDGARYVGSAYGEQNLLGRWLEHVSGERGVTVGLASRDPSTFRFSVLERVSPDAQPHEVIRLEQTWMTRLHTVRFGLNRPREAATDDEEDRSNGP